MGDDHMPKPPTGHVGDERERWDDKGEEGARAGAQPSNMYLHTYIHTYICMCIYIYRHIDISADPAGAAPRS